ncbi:SMI1/KNR4 family protein [Paenibacillus sp. FSL H8-0317]|uniref:SMI1/KNR4 family protein n=1 Tax=unclassified Paenibacillus TaxID=185978 RepID=UPI0038682391
MANMDRTNEKITINEILEFEGQYVLRLPEQYINFLLKYNGGYPEASTFKIDRLSNQVRQFLCERFVSGSPTQAFSWSVVY